MCQGLGDNYLSAAFILRGPESMRMVETKAAGAEDDQNHGYTCQVQHSAGTRHTLNPGQASYVLWILSVIIMVKGRDEGKVKAEINQVSNK